MATYVEKEFCENHKTQKTQETTTITNMSDKALRLDKRILPEFEFTLRDEVIKNLLDFVECPLLKDYSRDMIIFNKQSYDFERWDKWLDIQKENNQTKRKSGYGDSFCDKLIDPMTGDDVGYCNSLRYDYFSTYIPRDRLADILTKCIPLLCLEENKEFMPVGKNFTINDIVRHIRNPTKPREAIRK